jgi:CRISPR-associated exonuclease Cas4
MEHTSDAVYEGRLIHESAYPQRAEKYQEVELKGIKIDYYDPVKRVVHEIKKTDKIEDAHELQVKYYILALEKAGIKDVSGILEYPELRRKTPVSLNDGDRDKLADIEINIENICTGSICPPKIKSKICKNCSYFEFCYVNEDDTL